MSVIDRIFASLRHRLRITEQDDRLAGLSRELTRAHATTNTTLKKVAAELREVGREAAATNKRLRDLSASYRELHNAYAADRLILRRLDPAAAEQELEAVPVAPAVADVVDEDWWTLDACPVCHDASGTIVGEYNRFLVYGSPPEPAFHIYNYTLCGGCGVVYAARRPRGERFRRLVANFNEGLGRPDPKEPLLSSRALTEEERRKIAMRASAGSFVSELDDRWPDRATPRLQKDIYKLGGHIECIDALVPLKKGDRVIEVRSRSGVILAALRRRHQVDVYAVPIFEGQQQLVREAHGIPADHLIDFETGYLPYEGEFDLIIANHMLTHAVDPGAMLRHWRSRLKPNGHLYVYFEPDEEEFLCLEQSMFRVLNAFHLQTFNTRALGRMLRTHGFEPIYVGHSEADYMHCLARASTPEPARMPAAEGTRRRRRYEAVRDIAILQAPPALKSFFADEWTTALERASKRGDVTMDERGRLTFKN